MPVILGGKDVEQWLDPRFADPNALQRMLHPSPDRDLIAYPVSELVNSPRNQGAELVEPVRVLRKAS